MKEETIEELQNSIRDLRKQIHQKQKSIIYRRVDDFLEIEISRHNLQSEQKEQRERFRLNWCDSDADILGYMPTIFFLCDLESGCVIYVGDTAQPEKYLRRTNWKKHKFDTILTLSMPKNYLTNLQPVYRIRCGSFQRSVFDPKANKRWAW